ncbi:MAG: tetratricopeptide repeat protein [Bacillota bacterium]
MNINRRMLFFMVLFAFWSIFAIGCTSNEEKKQAQLDKQYAEALVLFEQGELEKASQLLQQCIDQSPDNGKYDFALGNIFRTRKDNEKALAHYLSATEKSPQIKEGYNNISAIYMLEGKYDEALAVIEDGLKKFPSFSDLIFKKAQLIYFKGEYEETIKQMQKIVTDSQYIEAYRFIGLSYLKLGDKVKALENLEIYLEKTPDDIKGKQEIHRIVAELK